MRSRRPVAPTGASVRRLPTRSSRNEVAQYAADPAICASVSAKSAVPSTPMAGATIGGSSSGGPMSDAGLVLAR